MIQINNLNFSYGKTKVFQDISLSFEKGNIYGVLGENGVGKTTLLKLICGLQKPKGGSLSIDSYRPFDRKPNFLQNIYFLPEEIITPDMTPKKYIKRTGIFYPRFDIKFFNTIIKEMEVDPTKKFSALSQGQKKKALVACALSLHTDYLLLDEPTNGLDIPSKILFRKIISQYCTDDSTIIISTHQVKDVENLIDPIIILDHDEVLLKANFVEITEKLYFDYNPERAVNAYYNELLPNGYLNVIPNESGAESKVNIEALFNTVIKNKKAIKELFKN